MNAEEQKSIKTVSLLIMILSGLMIFSNLMGAFMFTLLGFGEPINNNADETTFLDSIFENYMIICLVLVIIGGLYFIAGINLRKLKLWAKNLIVLLSGTLILINLAFVGLGIKMFIADKGMLFFMVLSLFLGIILSLSLFFLIRYLNKKEIREHFHR